MTDADAIALLARWVCELRWRNGRLERECVRRRRANRRLRDKLAARPIQPPVWFTEYHAYWIDRYTREEIRVMANGLEP